jgi:hypothetical protein
MLPEGPDELAHPLVRHDESSRHLRTRDRVLTIQTGPSEECFELVVVLPTDGLDILGDGDGGGAGSLGV